MENGIKLNGGGDKVNVAAQSFGDTVFVTCKMRFLSFSVFIDLKMLDLGERSAGDAVINTLYFVWSRDSASATEELNRIQFEPPETAIRSSEIP